MHKNDPLYFAAASELHTKKSHGGIMHEWLQSTDRLSMKFDTTFWGIF